MNVIYTRVYALIEMDNIMSIWIKFLLKYLKGKMVKEKLQFFDETVFFLK